MPSLKAYNNFLLSYYTHLKARFVKVIYIFILYIIFGLYILYKVSQCYNTNRLNNYIVV